MKKFSDFQDEKAIEVVADLLGPIAKIVANPQNGELAKSKNPVYFAKNVLKNNAKEVKEMLAILNGVPVAEYHCTAVSVLKDTIELFSDSDFMELFGLQSKTPTSAGSASMTTEVENQ